MMMKSIYLFIVVCLFTGLVSCYKSDRDNDTTTFAVNDHTLAQTLFGSIIKDVHEIALKDTFTNPASVDMTWDNCIDSVVLSTNGGSYPATLNIYFGGTSSCSDGIIKSGLLQVTASGKYLDSLSVYTIVPNNFYCDEIHLTGDITIKNTGKNENGNTVYNLLVDDGLLSNDTMHVEWNVNQKLEWTSGNGTSQSNDDVFLVSGDADGRSNKGNVFSVEVMTPLNFDLSCKWLVAGELKLLPNNLAIRTIDYGNGGCDDILMVTIYGKSKEIRMY